MAGNRKQYTQEFKDSAVKLITEQGYKLSGSSRRLGVDVSVLRRWKIAAEAGEKRGPGEQSSEGLQAEIKQLRKENHRLKLEREILKRSGEPILQFRFSNHAGDVWDDQQHEPKRQLLGQFCCGNFFWKS